MPRDDAGFGVHQNQVVKAELGDARGDLGNLGIRMISWIPRKWNEQVEPPQLDALRHRL